MEHGKKGEEEGESQVLSVAATLSGIANGQNAVSMISIKSAKAFAAGDAKKKRKTVAKKKSPDKFKLPAKQRERLKQIQVQGGGDKEDGDDEEEGGGEEEEEGRVEESKKGREST
jgi:hypothetical protein